MLLPHAKCHVPACHAFSSGCKDGTDLEAMKIEFANNGEIQMKLCRLMGALFISLAGMSIVSACSEATSALKDGGEGASSERSSGDDEIVEIRIVGDGMSSNAQATSSGYQGEQAAGNGYQSSYDAQSYGY